MHSYLDRAGIVSIPSSSGLIFDPRFAMRTGTPSFGFQSLLRQDSSSIVTGLATRPFVIDMVSIPSSSGLIFDRLQIEQSLEMHLGFNPFFVRTHLRSYTHQQSATLRSRVSIPSSSGLIFDRCGGSCISLDDP